MANFEQSLKKFLGHYEDLNRTLGPSDDGFYREFMELKTQSQRYKEQNTYPAESGLMPHNKKKNRFKDILPFEYTRVSLHPIDGVDGSDYINANYITGHDGEIDYIAAQGPLPHTVNDFWRMLWYHNIEIVVMSCKEVEMAKPKCQKYWPAQGEWLDFGAIKVTTTYEENVSNDFVIRDLLAECDGEQQHIRQYHYMSWPDHGKPSSPDPIIRMIEMVHSYRKRLDTPLVVHCSAGCGRTGTILGIDIARTMLLTKTVPEEFTTYKIVERMRQQRPAMVQAKDQYHFVYMAVSELARRAIGGMPTLPPKPAPKLLRKQPSNGEYGNVPFGGPSEDPNPSADSSADIYENLSSKELTPLPRSKTSTDKPPVPPPKNNSGYENTHLGNKPSGNGAFSRETPVVMPKPKNKSLQGDRLGEEEGNGDGSSGELYKTPSKSSLTPAPAPKPKPRRSVDSDSSLQETHTVPLVGTASLAPLKELPPTPQKVLPPTPQKALPPTPQKALPPTPQKELPPTPQKALPPTPQKVLPLTPQKERPLTPQRERPLNSQERPLTPQRERPLNSQERPLTPQREPPLNSQKGRESPQRRSLPDPPPKPTTRSEPSEDDSTYSTVDLTVIKDKGPDILVVDEDSGKKAPLDELTDKLEKSPKTSILDTLMAIVGDLPDEDFRSSSESPPLPPLPNPPASRAKLDFSDEVPPEVPRRTQASQELVPQPPSTPEKSTGPVADGVYEQPTLLSIPLPKTDVSKVQAVGSSTPQTYLSPSTPSSSTSLAQAIVTLPRATPSPGGHNQSFRAMGFLKKLRGVSKQEKKKVSLDDITGPVGGVVKSPSDQGLYQRASSPPRNADSAIKPTVAVTTSSESANTRYKFPGNIGYGVRIDRPKGPRATPSHWKSYIPNNVV